MVKKLQKKEPVKKPPVKAASIKKTGLSNPLQYAIIAALLLLTAVIYSNGLKGALLNFDDVEYFNNYPEVLKLSWHNVITYFSGYYVIMYQPLPVLSFALNYHFTELDIYPMHLVNLMFHLFNVLLVFGLLKKISGRFDVAIIVAGLFALHPMNVEAVSWISARSSGMYTFFYLLALLFYVDYLKKDFKWKYLVLVFVFFILSLFSKAQAVTLPVLLLLLDFYFKRKLISWRTLLEKIPFLALSVLFGIIAISDKGTMTNITEGMMIDYSLADAFFLLCYSVVFYFYKLFIPLSLAAVYVYPSKTDGYLPLIYYFSPAILIAIGIAIYFAARKRRYVVFGIALFILTISLNLQIIPSRLFIVTERYAYFPYIGLYFIIAMFFAEVFDKKFNWGKKLKPILLFLLLIAGISFSVTIYQRNEVWKNDMVFMTDILAKNSEVPYLSRAYGTRANAYASMKNYPEAIKDFSNAIRIKPDDAMSYFNRGFFYSKMNEYQAAVTDFDSAARYNPKQFIIYLNRSVAKYNLKDYKGTIADCNIGIGIDSLNHEIYNTRAAAEFFLNDYISAEKDFTRCIKLKPDYADVYKNRGNLYLNLNKMDEACNDWKRASQLGNTDVNTMIATYCK